MSPTRLRPMLPFPKPEPQAHLRARVKRDKASRRRECVLAVWRRAMGRCQNCQLRVVEPWSPYATAYNIGHVHEPRRRSRGADPTNPEEAVLLCIRCHDLAHRRRHERPPETP